MQRLEETELRKADLMVGVNCYLLYGKVNPSVLIGSFLVRILPYGPSPWKWSSAVYFFVFRSQQIQNKQGLSTI